MYALKAPTHDADPPVPSDAGLGTLRETIVGEVRLGEDLTLRQMAVLLTVYLTDEPQTVRGLARHLQVNRPAITRALDRLGEHHLVRREPDPNDRRSVLATRTPNGTAMMQRLKAWMAVADAQAAAGLQKTSED